VDDARFFSQSNKLVYDEPVDVETVAKHLADQAQHYTQYAGVRPFGVALIIGGIDQQGSSLFLTDPSGTYIPYNAVAIGSNSDKVTEFLRKEYKHDITVDDAKILAIAGINQVAENTEGSNHIKMSQIINDTKHFKILSGEEVAKIAQISKEKYAIEPKK
jgi:proteasome alpha subunit